MVISVAVKALGVTSVTIPVILFVNETFVEVPTVNLSPVKVKLPVVIAVDERLVKTGLMSYAKNVNQQLSEAEQFVVIINLLSTVIT